MGGRGGVSHNWDMSPNYGDFFFEVTPKAGDEAGLFGVYIGQNYQVWCDLVSLNEEIVSQYHVSYI